MGRKYFAALLPIIILAFGSCSKDSSQQPLSVTPAAIQVYSSKTEKIETNKADGVQFASSDTFYASVDANGIVTGRRKGEAEIRVSYGSETKSVPVTVLSRYTLYPDLESYIGETTDKVVSDFGEGFKWTRVAEKGEYIWSYENYTQYVQSIGFVTDYSASNMVKSIMVAVPALFLSELTDYLNERYEFVYMQNDQYLFLNHDKTVAVVYQVYSISTLMVTYMAYPAK